MTPVMPADVHTRPSFARTHTAALGFSLKCEHSILSLRAQPLHVRHFPLLIIGNQHPVRGFSLC